MDAVTRGLFIYLFLLVLFRLAGTRTVAQLTSFDLVLLLIISEATQQAMIDGDDSLTNSVLLIMTLVGADIGMSLIKRRWPKTEKWFDGSPIVLVEHGRPLREIMQKVRVDEEDVLAAAREHHGLERLAQVRYAVLETSGGITIIPEANARPGAEGASPASA
jgi:uncharacterized membrane protein YcaP (DUF421 family)